MGAALAAGEFSWDRYQGNKIRGDQKSCSEWVEEFRKHYIEDGGIEPTWRIDYHQIFKHLPEDGPLTVEALEALVTRTKPNTKTRVRACTAARKLAKFAGLEYDPTPLRGNYSPSKVAPREIPEDETIIRHYHQIPNLGWQWVYGIMATYGLRNHEVFHLDLEMFPIIRVKEATKTGMREVWPCYPEWAEEWRLDQMILPDTDLNRTNDRLGHSVTMYLSPKLPFSPYDLRHAWAVRTLEFGWPDALSAQQMGHSLEVHNRTYQRWISTRHHQRIYDLLVQRPDRPRPPQVA